jgi:hypothetical protein
MGIARAAEFTLIVECGREILPRTHVLGYLNSTPDGAGQGSRGRPSRSNLLRDMSGVVGPGLKLQVPRLRSSFRLGGMNFSARDDKDKGGCTNRISRSSRDEGGRLAGALKKP